jgi:hypothetical protein
LICWREADKRAAWRKLSYSRDHGLGESGPGGSAGQAIRHTIASP